MTDLNQNQNTNSNQNANIEPELLDNNGKKLSEPTEEQRKYMIGIYVLFGLSIVLGGLTAIIGAILAYMKQDEMNGTFYETHIQYLLRTFLGALIGIALGSALSIFGIGFIITGLAVLWYIFRVVLGIIRFFNKETVSMTSWLM